MSELLNCEALADRLHKSRNYITAMRRAGYEFKHRAPNLTTLEHALAWLDCNPSFKAHDYLQTNWKRLPKLQAAPQSQPV